MQYHDALLGGMRRDGFVEASRQSFRRKEPETSRPAGAAGLPDRATRSTETLNDFPYHFVLCNSFSYSLRGVHYLDITLNVDESHCVTRHVDG